MMADVYQVIYKRLKGPLKPASELQSNNDGCKMCSTDDNLLSLARRVNFPPSNIFKIR